MRATVGLAIALPAIVLPLAAQLSPEEKQLNTDSFEQVWSTIRDKHWETNPGGLDWNAIHAEFRPKIDKATTTEQARAIMREMLARLHETHFAIFPATVYEDVDVDSGGDGSAGLDLRVIESRAVVTDVEAGSSAEKLGVKPGWAILSVNGKDLSPVIEKLKADPEIHELTMERAVLGRLLGNAGEKLPVVFLDGANQKRALDLTLGEPRGSVSQFGNLPPMHVWIESKKIGNVGYVRFNMFLDLARVMSQFKDFVASCATCDGIVIDLRGNPGGIGGMAMGMAGFFVDNPDEKLGTMYTRGASMKFGINPRPPVFEGPLAVLVDGTSASTSEIFAGGLKDLGRAKVFGTRTAAAALPSIIQKLKNGDGFQYAVANYISEGGKALEGNGVIPDVEVKLTRQGLLSGHDAVVDAALDWMKTQRVKQ
jgi:carboxyl-terminal processing protease